MLACHDAESARSQLEGVPEHVERTALAEFAADGLAGDEVVRLDELRAATLEQRMRANPGLGRRGRVVEARRGLVAHHLFHEAF